MQGKKIFIKSISYSYLNLIATFFTGLVVFPLLIHRYGVVLYGLWALVLSFTLYINLFSFGMPDAMVTLMAQRKKNIDKYKIFQKTILYLTALSLFILLLFWLLFFCDKSLIITILGNVPKNDVSLAESLFLLMLTATFITIPLSLGSKFFSGLNLVYITQWYSLFTTLVNFLVVIAAVWFKLSLLDFAFCTMSGQALVALISVVHAWLFFIKPHNEECNLDFKSLRYLETSASFMQQTFVVLIVTATDVIVISHILDIKQVAIFLISFKIFSLGLSFLSVINSILQPAYGNCFANNDWHKINIIMNFILKIVVIITGVLWFGLLFWSKEVIMLVTHKADVFAGYGLFFFLGIYAYLLAFLANYSAVIIGLNYTKKMLKMNWTQAGLNLLFSLILVKKIGIDGAILGTILATLCTVFFLAPRKIKKLTNMKLVYNYKFVSKHFFCVLTPSLLLALYSIRINSFYYKAALFILVVIGYLVGSWLLLDVTSKGHILNLIFRKKPVGDQL